MIYRFLADTVVCLHLAFILFVVFGGLLWLWWRLVPWVHLPAAVWGAIVELQGWICPLTPLEVRFRELGGAAGYTGSFVDQYLVPVIYPPSLAREVQIGLGVLVCLVNVAIYAWVWHRRRAPGRSPAAW